MIKVLSRKRKNTTIKLFINNSDSKDEADSTVKKIALVSQRFLDVKLEYVGYMLHDQMFPLQRVCKNPLRLLYPNTKQPVALINWLPRF
ncbi:hypothetical protein [Candidatus Kuenenia stuttgartiensis]|uniref:hypothetical protein n=1 Tax=Kuenenia stuttgartiensis TaxID=174633 RepID=UPI00146C3576|nr:hypothetical protein [Candidatus Kuenenia stuttgartiensis]